MSTKMTLKCLFPIILFTLMTRVNGAELNCKKQLELSDRCAARALMIDRDVTIPTNIHELDGHCKRISENVRCISNYTPCLKRMPKVLYILILRNIRTNFKKRCETSDGKDEIIKHLKCFDKTNVDTLYKIMNGYSKVLDYIGDEVKLDEMIPNLCCSYEYMLDEGVKLIRDLCSTKTGPSTARYVKNMIESVFNSVGDLACGRHNSLAVCNKLMPKQMTIFKNLTAVGQKEEIKYTPLVPMLKIFQNLDAHMAERNQQ